MLLRIAIVLLVAHGVTAGQDWFSEEVLVRPVSANKYLVHFHLEQRTSHHHHQTQFPRPVAQLAHEVVFTSAQVALTHGRWHTKLWGLSPVPVHPVGAELRVVLPPGTSDAASRQSWSHLSHTLSGTFCASLNLLAAPDMWTEHRLSSLQALRDHQATALPRVLYASSSREPVCTENLTPWLKLLPCRDQGGLAALLKHRPTLYGADYYSMTTLIEVERDAHAAVLGVRLVQTLTLVLRTGLGGAPEPLTLAALLPSDALRRCPLTNVSRIYAAPVDGGGGGDAPPAQRAAAVATAPANPGASRQGGAVAWPSLTLRLQPLLRGTAEEEAAHGVPAGSGGGADGAGTLGSSQTAAFSVERKDTSAGSISSSSSSREGGGGALLLVHDLHQAAGGGAPAVVLPRWPVPPRTPAAAPPRAAGMPAAQLPAPAFLLERYVSGSGTLRGQMQLLLHRTCGDAPGLPGCSSEGADSGGPANVPPAAAPRVVCVFQPVPWYIRVWVHSLRLSFDGKEVPLQHHLLAHSIRPASDRRSMLSLDLCLHLPAGASTTLLLVEFTKAFLGVFEFPPDANRGFDVPAALVTYVEPRRALDRQWVLAGGGSSGSSCASSSGSGDSASSSGGDSSAESSDNVGTCAGDGGSCCGRDPAGSTPLLAEMTRATEQQVYSEGLLVTLAAPDFSMPYNVICLTSTVLAVFLGATANALIKREPPAPPAAGPASARARRLKIAQTLALVVLFAGVAVYLDEGLREQVAPMADTVKALLGLEGTTGVDRTL